MESPKRKHRVYQSRRRNLSFFRRLRVEPLEGRWLLNGSYDFGDAPEPYPTIEQTAPVADQGEFFLRTPGTHGTRSMIISTRRP